MQFLGQQPAKVWVPDVNHENIHGEILPTGRWAKQECMKWLKTAAALKPPVAGLGVPEPEAAGGRLRLPNSRF
jgi:hypothetical protein